MLDFMAQVKQPPQSSEWTVSLPIENAQDERRWKAQAVAWLGAIEASHSPPHNDCNKPRHQESTLSHQDMQSTQQGWAMHHGLYFFFLLEILQI